MTGASDRLRLTLMRHGRAENQAPGNRDFDRALDRRGVAEVAEMARRCLDLGLVPDLLLASAALRTVQTAEAFLRMLEGTPLQLQVEEGLYLAEAGLLLERIRSTATTVGHLMIVGHNPGLSDLAGQLAPEAQIGGFETGATCSMAFAASNWESVRPGRAEDLRYHSPGRLLDLSGCASGRAALEFRRPHPHRGQAARRRTSGIIPMSVATSVTAASFAAEVLEASRQQPVLVDFWAPWCGPCRTLGPVLDDVAREFAGRLKVVKLNTDDEQALASQFQIRGIPAVKLFRDGKVVAEFVGAQPVSAVRAFLMPHLPAAANDPLEHARALQARGAHAEAIAALRAAAAAAPDDPTLATELARALALSGDAVGAEALVAGLAPAMQSDPQVKAVRALAHFARIVSSPDETDAIQTARVMAGRALLRGGVQSGLDALLAAMHRNRRYAAGQGRADLVLAFDLAPPEHPGVAAARRSLAALLH